MIGRLFFSQNEADRKWSWQYVPCLSMDKFIDVVCLFACRLCYLQT